MTINYRKKCNLLLNIPYNKAPKRRGCKGALHLKNKWQNSNIGMIGSYALEL